MSFFDKLKRGLSKTKDGLLKQIDGIFRSFVHVDEDMLEELEELLITADVGVGPTEKIVRCAARADKGRPHQRAGGCKGGAVRYSPQRDRRGRAALS